MSDNLRKEMALREHVPVMLHQCVAALNVADGKTYVDGTFGAGGYSRAILTSANCRLFAIDRDPDAIKRAEELKKEFPDRFFPLHGCFGDMAALLKAEGVEEVDGIVLDIGVSSMQIDQGDRGFSFNKQGALDMRMSQEGISAADVVNEMAEAALADIIYKYGEEHASRRIAKRIVEERKVAPIDTTIRLAEVIHKVLPNRHDKKTDTATKTFQALRIYVNDELGELERALNAAEELLTNEGRLVVVAFHSLEDGIVKQFIKDKSGKAKQYSRHMPMPLEDNEPHTFKALFSSSQKPEDEEIAANPRSRSARLRAAIRTKDSEGEK